jgi:hypothetical protein
MSCNEENVCTHNGTMGPIYIVNCSDMIYDDKTGEWRMKRKYGNFKRPVMKFENHKEASDFATENYDCKDGVLIPKET